MTLPPWAEPLLDADRMRATDRWAIEERGVPSLDLMERAGEGLARVVAEHAPSGRVAVVCGKGNNGGDGLVAARLLRGQGRDVEVMLIEPDEVMTPDAQTMRDRLAGDPPVAYEPGRLDGAAAVVDALLGTGFQGRPREPLAGVIAGINAAGAPVVAADVPSGVDASTGEVAGEAIRAVATATFHRGKPGLWIHPGKAHAGRVAVIDIGIPHDTAPDTAREARASLITPAVMDDYPRRGAASTKFDSGVVVVLGGSRGLAGAPCMAALGAMRAGAGYLTIGVPEAIEASLAARAPVEAMLLALPAGDGALLPEALEPALAAVGRAGAVVLGPGLGRRPGALEFAREAVERVDTPLVVDADGLNALAEDFPGSIADRTAPTVMTPHAGELARMVGASSKEVDARRAHHARAAADASGAVVVLKGDDTLVVEPKGGMAISAGGSPALATAGTGDVLSGVVAAMLARGLPPLHAACAAVHLHSRAGRLAAERMGADAVVASDVIAALPAALRDG